ncbi:MAG TPA: hypothetical protein VLM81_04505 [Peptostreptococcaceae bacterium]|nr:hypothetical protein [Peptostreptococcaceae bacterium]
MKNYYELLGLNIDEVKSILNLKNIRYEVKETIGFKDKDKLVIPKVINIKECGDKLEIIVTYFSDSLN